MGLVFATVAEAQRHTTCGSFTGTLAGRRLADELSAAGLELPEGRATLEGLVPLWAQVLPRLSLRTKGSRGFGRRTFVPAWYVRGGPHHPADDLAPRCLVTADLAARYLAVAVFLEVGPTAEPCLWHPAPADSPSPNEPALGLGERRFLPITTVTWLAVQALRGEMAAREPEALHRLASASLLEIRASLDAAPAPTDQLAALPSRRHLLVEVTDAGDGRVEIGVADDLRGLVDDAVEQLLALVQAHPDVVSCDRPDREVVTAQLQASVAPDRLVADLVAWVDRVAPGWPHTGG